MKEDRHRLAVIIPIHNEVKNIRPFYTRAKASLDSILELESWQLIFCNNGSEDDSFSEVLSLHHMDSRVKVITLSRNFGYQGALIAGLSSVDTDLYAMIDVDCEDPPELLPEFFKHVLEGADLVYGIRSQREESAVITFFRRLFYVLNRGVADSEIVMWMAEFSMMTRQVRDAILAPRTTYPFLRAEMGYVGFKRIGVPYFRARRKEGASHYNLYRMAKFAIAGILSSTTFPLRLMFYCACAVALGYPVAVWLLDLSFERTAWMASVVSLYFLLLSVPLIALYLARTYKNGMARPLFVIDKGKTIL